MKFAFWVFGGLQFIFSMFPSRLTGGWFGITHDAGQIVDTLCLISAILCIGFGCIISELQKQRRN